MQPEENSFEAQNPKNSEDIEDKRKQILLTTPTKNNREFQVSRNLYSQNIKKSGPLVTEFLEPLSVKRRQTMNLSINQDDRENSAICQTPIGSNFECEDKEKFIYQKIIKNTRVSAFENVVERGLFSKEIEYLEPVKSKHYK